jgi:hypothetical protein
MTEYYEIPQAPTDAGELPPVEIHPDYGGVADSWNPHGNAASSAYGFVISGAASNQGHASGGGSSANSSVYASNSYYGQLQRALEGLAEGTGNPGDPFGALFGVLGFPSQPKLAYGSVAGLEQPSFNPQRRPSEGPRSTIPFEDRPMALTPVPNLRDLQNFQDPISDPRAGIFDIDRTKVYPSEETRTARGDNPFVRQDNPGPFMDLVGQPEDIFFQGGMFGIPTVNTLPTAVGQWMSQVGLSGNTFQTGALYSDPGGATSRFGDEIIDPTGFFPDQ